MQTAGVASARVCLDTTRFCWPAASLPAGGLQAQVFRPGRRHRWVAWWLCQPPPQLWAASAPPAPHPALPRRRLAAMALPAARLPPTARLLPAACLQPPGCWGCTATRTATSCPAGCPWSAWASTPASWRWRGTRQDAAAAPGAGASAGGAHRRCRLVSQQACRGSSAFPPRQAACCIVCVVPPLPQVGLVRQVETAAVKKAGDNKAGPFERRLTSLHTRATLEVRPPWGADLRRWAAVRGGGSHPALLAAAACLCSRPACCHDPPAGRRAGRP